VNERPLKALVTGANGFVGSYLSRALAESGHNVSGLYVDENSPAWNYLECCSVSDIALFRCDVSKRDEVEKAFKKTRPDIVFHLAAVSFNPFCNANPGLTFDINTFGTANICRSMLDFAPEARLVFVSTCEVYGRAVGSPEPVNETAVPEPVNPYPVSKRCAEMIVGKTRTS